MNQTGVIIFAVALAVAAAIYIIYNRQEPFWNLPSQTVRVEKVYSNDGVNFWQTPNYEGTLSPRFSNVNYGANLRANLPPYETMAVPTNPLGDAPMVADGFNPTERPQTITRDRYIYANKGSRLRGMGDPFRGDLPIVPPTGNWFVPTAKPNIDLQHGALTVMGGVGNETSQRLAQLIHASSGNTATAIGGSNIEFPDTVTATSFP